MEILLTIAAVFLILLGNEIWWRKRHIHGEFSRKFVHITVGSFVAFWPFYLSWLEIRELSLAFIVVVGLSKYLKLFRAIHSVQRPTWGEIFFAMAVGTTALITHDKGVYVAAILQMSLADGLAAVIGSNFGKAQSYSIFGHRKTVLGTVTFFVTSLLIMLGVNHWGGTSFEPGLVVLLAAGASIIENFGVRGLDNLLVPVLVAVVLANA